jgi:hypothetical protein
LDDARDHADSQGALVADRVVARTQRCDRAQCDEMSPAAGPLRVSSESDRNVVRIPPMIAVKMPAIGGYPLASEMPRHSGNAIRITRKPDSRSFFQ